MAYIMESNQTNKTKADKHQGTVVYCGKQGGYTI